MLTSVLVEDTNRVRWIRFNRPEKLNVLRREDILATRVVMEEACNSMDAVVFCGVGDRSFSAGIHVDDFLGLTPGDARTLIGDLKALLEAARRAPIPTICAINGYCLGGAMELAMACDIRIAVSHAKFGMPEIKVGIPSVLDAALLHQHVGLSKAKEMLLTGDLYGAEEMERYGFLNKVVEQDKLEDEVVLFLDRVTAHAKPTLAAQKRLFETWQNTGLQESIHASMNEFALVFGEKETQDAIVAYAGRLKD